MTSAEERDFFAPYIPVVLNGYKLLIYKSHNQWEICLRDEDDSGYPSRIGLISIQGRKGPLNDCTNLAWQMYHDHKGLGIMKEFLKLFINEYICDVNGFSVVIDLSNTPSLKLALGAGFQIYKEEGNRVFLNIK